MDFSESAIILRTGGFREHDLWVRFLVPSRGVLTAFAFGGRISRRRFCGCLEPLSRVRLTVQQSRRGNYLQLAEGSLQERHARLKADPGRLGLAVHCLKFVEAVQLGPEGSAAAHELLAQALARLDDPRGVPAHWALFFRARLAFLQGYGPDPAALAACQACAKPLEQMTAPRLAVEKGVLACSACLRPAVHGGVHLPAGPDAATALRAALAQGPLEWADAPLPPRARRECFDIVEAFVEYHLGLRMAGAGFARV